MRSCSTFDPDAGLRGPRPDRLQIALDLAPPLHQVEVCLQSEKEALRQSEIARQPQISIGCHVALAEYDFVDAARRHMNRPRERILAEPHGLEKLLKQDLARVRIWQEVALSCGNRRFRQEPVLPQSIQNKFATGR